MKIPKRKLLNEFEKDPIKQCKYYKIPLDILDHLVIIKINLIIQII